MMLSAENRLKSVNIFESHSPFHSSLDGPATYFECTFLILRGNRSFSASRCFRRPVAGEDRKKANIFEHLVTSTPFSHFGCHCQLTYPGTMSCTIMNLNGCSAVRIEEERSHVYFLVSPTARLHHPPCRATPAHMVGELTL